MPARWRRAREQARKTVACMQPLQALSFLKLTSAAVRVTRCIKWVMPEPASNSFLRVMPRLGRR